MSLIKCPNPACSHEVVHNWLSCPKCRCPVQVLLAAQAAAAAEEAAIAEAEAELEAEKPSGRMLQRLKEAARDSLDDEEPAPDTIAPEVVAVDPNSRGGMIDKAGTLMMGFGGGAVVGLPFLWDQPGLATFLGIAAVVCGLAGMGLKQVAQSVARKS